MGKIEEPQVVSPVMSDVNDPILLSGKRVRKALFQAESEDLAPLETKDKDGVIENERVKDGHELCAKVTNGIMVATKPHIEAEGIRSVQKDVTEVTVADGVMDADHEDDPMITKKSNISEDTETMHGLLTKPERKKIAKGNPLLKGASSRKRLVQALVSPRKKMGQRRRFKSVTDCIRES